MALLLVCHHEVIAVFLTSDAVSEIRDRDLIVDIKLEYYCVYLQELNCFY